MLLHFVYCTFWSSILYVLPHISMQICMSCIMFKCHNKFISCICIQFFKVSHTFCPFLLTWIINMPSVCWICLSYFWFNFIYYSLLWIILFSLVICLLLYSPIYSSYRICKAHLHIPQRHTKSGIIIVTYWPHSMFWRAQYVQKKTATSFR